MANKLIYRGSKIKIGKVYGNLEIVRYKDRNKENDNFSRVFAKCSCGKLITSVVHQITEGYKTDCGHIAKQKPFRKEKVLIEKLVLTKEQKRFVDLTNKFLNIMDRKYEHIGN